jgi:hypothetical protein
MSTGARILVLVLVAGTLTLATGVVVTAAAIAGAGTIAVEFEESRGDRVSVSVPAGLINLALFVVPDRLVERAMIEVDQVVVDEVGAYLPAIRSAWDELDRAPDFVIVEVDGPDEKIRIRKSAGMILVTVDSDDLAVDVSFPLSTVDRVLRKL